VKGDEYWLARELAEVLQYAQWHNFHKVIDRAEDGCEPGGVGGVVWGC